MKKTRNKFIFKNFDNAYVSSNAFSCLKIYKRKKQIARFFPVNIFDQDKTSDYNYMSTIINNKSNFRNLIINDDGKILVDDSETQVFIHLDKYLNALILYSFIKNLYNELRSKDCILTDNVKNDVWTTIRGILALSTITIKHKLNLSLLDLYFNSQTLHHRPLFRFITARSRINSVVKRVYLDTLRGFSDLLEYINFDTTNNKVNQCCVSGLFFRNNDTFSFYHNLNRDEFFAQVVQHKIPYFSFIFNNDSDLFINKEFVKRTTLNNDDTIYNFIRLVVVDQNEYSEEDDFFAEYHNGKQTVILNSDQATKNKFPCVALTSNNNRLRAYNFRVHNSLPYAHLPTQKNIKDNIYLGVELEVNKSARCPNKINQMLEEDILKGTAIVKSDGSLGSRGLEINVVPMTLEYAKATDYYFNLQHKTKDYLHSYRDYKTGLHVHVSRKLLTNYQIGLIGQFINKSRNYGFIKDICGRDLNDGNNDYANTNSNYNIKKFMRQRVGKYTAFNTLNDATVEFRIFKGNLSAKTIYRYLEFVHALVTMVKSSSMKPSTHYLDFQKWVTQNNSIYKVLYSHITFNDCKIDNFSMKFKKVYKTVDFKMPTIDLAKPLRQKRVRAIYNRSYVPQQTLNFTGD